VGQALEQVRIVVDERVSGEERTKLKNDLSEGTKGLVDLKELIRDNLKWFYEPDGLIDVRDQVTDNMPKLLNLFVVVSFLFFILGMCSTCCWVFREKTGESYNKSPHRIACCTMCCAIPLVVIPTLVLGGILDVATTGIAAVCLTMDGLDGDRYRNMAGALDANLSNVNTMADVIDTCLAGSRGVNPNMLDYINTTFEGEPRPVREVLYEISVEPIETAFASIDERLAEESATGLKDDRAVKALTNMLVNTPVDAMMLPVPDKFSSDSNYDALFADATLRDFIATSTRCDNIEIDGNTIPGVSSFLANLDSETSDTLVASYPAPTCFPGPGEALTCSGTNDKCTGGEKFLAIKYAVRMERVYRCDLWEAADGSFCDPKDMVKVGDTWTNDCMRLIDGENKIVWKQRFCNLEEFTEYVQQYKQRIDVAMDRLSDVTLTFTEELKVTFRGIIDTYFLDPLNKITSGITCGFLPPAYKGVINGMCFQGAVGFRQVGKAYTIFGSSVLAMAIVLYFAWRFEVDNVNVEESNKGGA